MRIPGGPPELSDSARARLEALIGSAPDEAAPRRACDDEDDSPGPVLPETEAEDGWQERAREFTGRHAVSLVLAAVGVVCLGVWNVFHARPVPVTAAPLASGGQMATPSAASATPGRLIVHVLGAVTKPGVVDLPAGSRVSDALDRCGGLRADADPADLNLASPLSDGDQIVIGTANAPQGEKRGAGGSDAAGGNESGGSSAAQVDLNSATQAQLEAIPGVGPVTAGKIIAWRQQHGRFTRVEELGEVDGIGPKTLARIKPYVRI